MAGKKSRASRVSMGGRQKSNLHHEEKRQAYFAQKREQGRAYEYHKNPYEKGSEEWFEEEAARAEKRVNKRLPLARWTSIMTKLENQVAKERLAAKEKEVKRNSKKQ